MPELQAGRLHVGCGLRAHMCLVATCAVTIQSIHAHRTKQHQLWYLNVESTMNRCMWKGVLMCVSVQKYKIQVWRTGCWACGTIYTADSGRPGISAQTLHNPRTIDVRQLSSHNNRARQVGRCLHIRSVRRFVSLTVLAAHSILTRKRDHTLIHVQCFPAPLHAKDFGGVCHMLVKRSLPPARQVILQLENYPAPEVMKSGQHVRQSDIWSVGCCLLEMLTAQVRMPLRVCSKHANLHSIRSLSRTLATVRVCRRQRR